MTKSLLETGEGTFDSYKINIKAETVGYLLPRPNEEALVGSIVIDSPNVYTKDGFHVGSIFGDILTKYPDVAVHGSEIEGQTHAIVNDMSFRLNSYNNTYELDKRKLPVATKITEIIID